MIQQFAGKKQYAPTVDSSTESQGETSRPLRCIIPSTPAHGTQWALSITFCPLLNTMNMEAVRALPCDNRAVFSRGLTMRTRRVKQQPTDAAGVLALDVPSPSADQVDGIYRHVHRVTTAGCHDYRYVNERGPIMFLLKNDNKGIRGSFITHTINVRGVFFSDDV
jgi:hypothetical protein